MTNHKFDIILKDPRNLGDVRTLHIWIWPVVLEQMGLTGFYFPLYYCLKDRPLIHLIRCLSKMVKENNLSPEIKEYATETFSKNASK